MNHPWWEIPYTWGHFKAPFSDFYRVGGGGEVKLLFPVVGNSQSKYCAHSYGTHRSIPQALSKVTSNLGVILRSEVFWIGNLGIMA